MRPASLVVVLTVLALGNGAARAQEEGEKSMLEKLILEKEKLPAGVRYAELPEGEAPPAFTANPMLSADEQFVKALFMVSGPGVKPADAPGVKQALLAVYEEKSLVFVMGLELQSEDAAKKLEPKLQKAYGDDERAASAFRQGAVCVWMFRKRDVTDLCWQQMVTHVETTLGLKKAEPAAERGAASPEDMVAKAKAAWEKGDAVAAERLINWDGTPPEIARMMKSMFGPTEGAVPADQLTVEIGEIDPKTSEPMEHAGKSYVPNVEITGTLVIKTDDGAGNKSQLKMPIGKAADGRYYISGPKEKE